MKLFFTLKIIILSFLQVVLCISITCAQDSKSYTIIDELQKNNSYEGSVNILSDVKISGLIGKYNSNPSTVIESGEEQFVKMAGYKVSVYSGNSQKAKEEAFSRERIIRDGFPDVSTSVTYKSPIWRLRVGDFHTNEEATMFMYELKQTFPDMGKEMYVVSDEIKVPLNY